MRILSTLAAFSLSATVAFADGHQADIEADLNAWNDRFNELAASWDLEGIVALYDEDALWIAPKSRPAPGPETARQTFSFAVENKGSLVHTVDELIISDDGSQAVMIGDAIVKVETQGLDFTGTYLFVLEREDDTWLIQTDMFNQHIDE